MANRVEYIELGLACADVCDALKQWMKDRKAFNPTVLKAIKQLTMWVGPAGMQIAPDSLTAPSTIA